MQLASWARQVPHFMIFVVDVFVKRLLIQQGPSCKRRFEWKRFFTSGPFKVHTDFTRRLFRDMLLLTSDTSASQATDEEAPADFLQPLRSARYLRILRAIRILRILKAGKINVLLENLVISMGRQWLILGFTVGKMLLAIGAVAHILACSWFALGDAVSDSSWLDIAGIKNASFQIQQTS